jgi:Arc/MetJ-type ribon-helix-helix transcriptional regulator
VSQQLQSGKYQSYDEMVEAGLRLLQEQEAGHCQLVEQTQGMAYSPHEHTGLNQPI